MRFTISGNGVPRMSAAVATDTVRKMVRLESRGPGDTENALRRLAMRFRLPFWTLWHLRKGRAKGVDSDILRNIRQAYLRQCQQQIDALRHEMEVEKAQGFDDLEDLAAEAAALAAKVAARRR